MSDETTDGRTEQTEQDLVSAALEREEWSDVADALEEVAWLNQDGDYIDQQMAVRYEEIAEKVRGQTDAV